MKINYSTPVDVLMRRKIIGRQAYRICLTMQLSNVEDILKTKVSLIDRNHYCDQNTLLHFCSIHKAFSEGNETRNIGDIIAIRKGTEREKKQLIIDFADHIARSQNDENIRSLTEASTTPKSCTELLEKYYSVLSNVFGQKVTDGFKANYPSMKDFLIHICNMDHDTLNELKGYSGLDRISIRQFAIELLNAVLQDEELSYEDKKKLEIVMNEVSKKTDFFDAMDIFSALDKPTLKSFIQERDDCLTQHGGWHVKMEDYDPKGIVEDLRMIYSTGITKRGKDYYWYPRYIDEFSKIFDRYRLEIQLRSKDPIQLKKTDAFLAEKHSYLTPEERSHIIDKVKQ